MSTMVCNRWFVVCLDCDADAWIVFDEGWIARRWIAAHELETAHAHIDSWNGALRSKTRRTRES